MKLKLDFTTVASSVVEIELTDDELKTLADELETSVDKLTVDDLLEIAEDKAYEKLPHSLCAHCSGMFGSSYKPGVELGGEWEFDDTADAEARYRGIRIVEE
jgi:hypothetical protein